MAKIIADTYGIPFITALKHNRGKEQKLLSYNQRFKNAKSIYEVIDPPQEKYKRLLLVDDVATTGATVSACKSLILQDYAKSVTILVLAKTPLRKNTDRE